MNSRENVSSWQMAALLFVYTTGSTILYIPSPLLAAAGSGAWLSWFFSGIGGLVLLSSMLYLTRRYPGQSLVECSMQTFGYAMTVVIMLPYLVFALLLSSYIYFSVGFFFTTTMMKETPLYVFNALIALVSAMTARAGMEVIARMFTMVLVILMGSILIVLILGIPYYHFEYLLPVMPHGFKPQLHGVYLVFGFLYGDFVVFAMLFSFIRMQKGTVRIKPIYIAYLCNWIILLFVNLCTLMSLGPMTYEFRYPIYILARMISIQEIVERGESVIGISLLAGSYMKSTITLYALNLTVEKLLKVQDNGIIIYPLALLGFYLSVVSVKQEAAFSEVLLSWPLVTFSASLPVYLLCIVTLLKKRGKGRNGGRADRYRVR
ncbi:GerAB/ArcD/ProY family transporter [Paenibacillus contaminans]|uniref:Spore gernimation protein n=1 Tax=Paenibacillus contaminans TaxID=450362 RepID=A0A329MUW9_9BACL|nr:endospore germination permease [Paenibacillus contaminans]RAV23194.1 spore gernimation protein [Paenibacillus contaminans]